MQNQHSDDGNTEKQLGVALVFSQTSELYRLGKEEWRREGRRGGTKEAGREMRREDGEKEGKSNIRLM